MLIRSTWTLSPTDTTILPRSYSLELVKDLHKRMELTMGEEAIPPIIYSGLQGAISVSKDFLTFNSSHAYQLSLCGLQEGASKAIANLNLSPTLDFLGASFEVVNRENEITSYESLYQSLVAAEPEPVQRFDLKFTTPTAFAQNRTYLPLPVPTLMFRSWLDRWNQFAPVYLGSDELIGYLGEVIVLNHHKLQTHSFQIHSSKINGFVGDVTLKVLSRTEPLLAHVAALLLDYAQFAGTGIKTRLGMGQTIKRC